VNTGNYVLFTKMNSIEFEKTSPFSQVAALSTENAQYEFAGCPQKHQDHDQQNDFNQPFHSFGFGSVTVIFRPPFKNFWKSAWKGGRAGVLTPARIGCPFGYHCGRIFSRISAKNVLNSLGPGILNFAMVWPRSPIFILNISS